MKSSKIRIVEVGPRDGLQNEAKKISVTSRLKLVRLLAEAGLNQIEVGAFVSPKWVPQMSDTFELVHEVFKGQSRGEVSKKANFSVLVPNMRGMEDAIKTPIREVAIFGACSESFSRKNINCSIEESFERFAQVLTMAKSRKIKVRGYLSTAFGCPYEGKVDEKVVVKLVNRMIKMGVYEVSIGDTIGVATPKQVRSLIKKIKKAVGLKKIALHLHDTRGTALANVLAGYDLGVKVFDASVGGLGGCPYAPGASGNLATEDLVYLLKGMGEETGVDLQKLIEIKRFMENEIGRPLPSRVGNAGLPKAGTIF